MIRYDMMPTDQGANCLLAATDERGLVHGTSWRAAPAARHERLAAGRRGARPFSAEFPGLLPGRLQRFTPAARPQGQWRFSKRCGRRCTTSPGGETRSYGDIARAIGKLSNAVRAVGAANGRNPLSIIIPATG